MFPAKLVLVFLNVSAWPIYLLKNHTSFIFFFWIKPKFHTFFTHMFHNSERSFARRLNSHIWKIATNLLTSRWNFALLALNRNSKLSHDPLTLNTSSDIYKMSNNVYWVRFPRPEDHSFFMNSEHSRNKLDNFSEEKTSSF